MRGKGSPIITIIEGESPIEIPTPRLAMAPARELIGRKIAEEPPESRIAVAPPVAEMGRPELDEDPTAKFAEMETVPVIGGA